MQFWNPKKRKEKNPPFQYMGYYQSLDKWSKYFEKYYPTNDVFDLIWLYLWNMNLKDMTILLVELDITKENLEYYRKNHSSPLDLLCRRGSSAPEDFIFFLKTFKCNLKDPHFDIIFEYSQGYWPPYDDYAFWDTINLNIYYIPSPSSYIPEHVCKKIKEYQKYKKNKSFVVIKRNIQNWLYKPLCRDNTIGIVPRVGLRILDKDK